MSTANPYAVAPGTGASDETAPSFAPDFRYAAPSLEDNPLPAENGFAPTHENGQVTDPARIGRVPSRSFRAGDIENFFEIRNRDIASRHSVEFIDADGFEIVKGELRRAPDPRWTPSPESRPTQRMSPHRYVFTRPFDQHSARRFNGSHFSMADHRRTYDIYGMQPATTRRNTAYRMPAPWDTDIVDEPSDLEPDVLPGRVEVINLPPPNNRAWRL